MKARLNPEVLDELRQKHGLSSDEKLAHNLGVSKATIQNWRKGSMCPNIAHLLKIQLKTSRKFEDMLLIPEVAA
ncbi:helix-turn-helix domain-containing protein [Corynebacterium propinquum]